MSDQNLTNYIRQCLTANLSRPDITGILLDASWPQEVIDQAFNDVIGSPVSSAATPKLSVSQFNKNRLRLIWLIGIRLALIPIQSFFLPALLYQSRSYNATSWLNPLGFFLGVLLPIAWIVPLWGIWQRKRMGYTLAIIFASVLILLNGSVAFALVSQLSFINFSIIYLITGILIIIFARSSLKFFPKQEGTIMQMQIDPTKVRQVNIVMAFLFGLTVIIPGIFSDIMNHGHFATIDLSGLGFGPDFLFIMFITFLFGSIAGWTTANRIIANIRKGKSSWGTGMAMGLYCGAMAQLPVWGWSGWLVIAIPVGMVIGIALGAIAVSVIHEVVKSLVAKPSLA